MRLQTNCVRLAATGLLVAAMTSAVGVAAQADPVRMTMVGAWPPKVSAAADMGIKFMDTVNELAAGKLHITFKGSRDVVPTFDQPEALVKGVFDSWYGAPNYWAGVVPGGYVMELSRAEYLDNGPGSELFEFIAGMYKRRGVQYLGHFSGEPDTGNHFIYTQKKISSISDLKGMKIRVPPLTRHFIKAIGAEPVTLPPGEVYLALERGTVEGFSWPFYDGFTAFGWEKVSKFIIHQPLYRDGTSVMMNLAKWNTLSGDVKKQVFEATRRTQAWSQGWVSAYQAVQLAAMQKAGMKVINLSKEDKVRWNRTADTALWAHFKSVMSPDDYATARRLLGGS